jgi:hypothetical protein
MNTEAGIAYCAGLYEGEGSLITPSRGSARLAVQMTDLEPLQKFQSIMGGRISGPFTDRKRPGRKPWWCYAISNWGEVSKVIILIRPWLSPRRQARIDEALARMPQHFRRPFAFIPCDYEPVASPAGYLKHRRKGERACATCLKSNRMYYEERARRQGVIRKDAHGRQIVQRVRTSKVMSKTLDDARLSAVPMGPSAFSGSDPVS